MTQYLFSRRSLGMSGVLAVVLAGLAASPAMAGTRSANAPCSPPQLSQPFASTGDPNWYMLAPGQTPDSFDATGWTLTGGAKLLTTTLADGETGQVLDLPSGSQAISPRFCVQSDFQTARGVVQDLAGSEGVTVSVSYDRGDSSQSTGVLQGDGTGWTVSAPVGVAPASRPGQQHVQFTLAAGGTDSEFQVYDFYVDPRMR